MNIDYNQMNEYKNKNDDINEKNDYNNNYYY